MNYVVTVTENRKLTIIGKANSKAEAIVILRDDFEKNSVKWLAKTFLTPSLSQELIKNMKTNDAN